MVQHWQGSCRNYGKQQGHALCPAANPPVQGCVADVDPLTPEAEDFQARSVKFYVK